MALCKSFKTSKLVSPHPWSAAFLEHCSPAIIDARAPTPRLEISQAHYHTTQVLGISGIVTSLVVRALKRATVRWHQRYHKITTSSRMLPFNQGLEAILLEDPKAGCRKSPPNTCTDSSPRKRRKSHTIGFTGNKSMPRWGRRSKKGMETKGCSPPGSQRLRCCITLPVSTPNLSRRVKLTYAHNPTVRTQEASVSNK